MSIFTEINTRISNSWKGFWTGLTGNRDGSERSQEPMIFPMQGFSGFGGDQTWGWLKRLLPGSRRDFAAESGDLWLNSIVGIVYNWVGRVFPEAPFVVYKKTPYEGAQDEFEIIKDHPLAKLIKTPNEFYTGTILWMATILSLMVSGNSFWFVERSAAGMPIRLWWTPFWMVRPVWEPGTNEYIKAYRYHVNGVYYLYNEKDFIHFRIGLDPRDVRMGLSPLAAEARHVCSDNDWATYSAALAHNMGVPGVVITPPARVPTQTTGGSGKDIQPQIGLATVNLIKSTWVEKFSKDKAGMPMVMDTPLEIKSIGLSPRELAVDAMRKLPEERICAALGVPAVVAGLGAGLSQAGAKASHEDSQRQAYYGNIIPTQRILSEELDLQLLPDLGNVDEEFCGFDTTRVWFLKPVYNDVLNAACKGFMSGILKLNEGRRRVGEPLDTSDKGNKYAWELGIVGKQDSNGSGTGDGDKTQSQTDDDDEKKVGKGPGKSKSHEDDYED